VCGKDKECKATTVAFRQLNDIRGHMVSMPAMTTTSFRTNTATMKMKKLERWKSHLRIESSVINEIEDNRKRSHDAVNQPTLRSHQKENTRTLKYVAVHHFHPVLLKEEGLGHHYDTANRFHLKDTVPISAVRGSSIGQSTVYSGVDKANDNEFFFVPSYTVERVDEDLKQINHQAELLAHAARLALRGNHLHTATRYLSIVTF
jgi:hypothetical protein